MLSALLIMTLILAVSAGNLALGFGLAVHLGHGPADGWNALCFWKPAGGTNPAGHGHAPPPSAHSSGH
jgi:hypothetical protein